MASGTLVWTILIVYGFAPVCSMPPPPTNQKTPASQKGRCPQVEQLPQRMCMVQSRLDAIPCTVDGRCPQVEQLPQRMCMVQSRRDAIPCTVDGDCFLSSQICCPHYCGTRVCKIQSSMSKLPDDGSIKGANVNTKRKPTGSVVPTNIKHRQNVPTIDDLAASVPATTKARQGRCPSAEELEFEMCMLQTRQEATSCTTDRDCSRFNQICCPHYCGTRVCKGQGGDDGTSITKPRTNTKPKPTGNVVPTNIKHRQNVPTIDDLVASVSGTSRGDKRDRCPSVEELPYEMCLMQTRQDAMTCTKDGDCFLPNQICCSHHCGTRVCKTPAGERERPKKKSGGKPKTSKKIKSWKPKQKPSGKRVPPYVKHRQNVPTIDDLAANMRKQIKPRQMNPPRQQRNRA